MTSFQPPTNPDLEAALENYLSSSNKAPLMMVKGDTGSGKTLGVFSFLCTHMGNLRSTFLLPRWTDMMDRAKSSGIPQDRLRLTTLPYFCQAMLRGSHVARNIMMNMDLLVLDEFHHESTEWMIVLMMLRYYRKSIHRMPKLIFISATLADYHFGIMETFLEIPRVRLKIFEVINPRSFTRDIVYDNDFHPGFHHQPQLLAEKILAILKDPNYSSKRRVLVFLHSPDICEHVGETLTTLLGKDNKNIFTCRPWIVGTVHGQKDKEENDEVLHSKELFQVIIGTNKLETSITIPRLDMVLDFGICMVPDAYGTVLPRYCSQSEMIQRAGRAGRTCDSTVVRMMSRTFFQSMPYSLSNDVDYTSWILRAHLEGEASFQHLSRFFSSGDQVALHPVVMYEVEGFTRLVSRAEDWGLLTLSRGEPDKKLMRYLLKTSFHAKFYRMILNADAFQKKHPTVVTILTTAVVAYLDTIFRYGNKVFYIPRTSLSYTSLLNHWKIFLARVSKYNNNDKDDDDRPVSELQRMIEIMVTMVMRKDAYGKFCEEYHINNRIFRQVLSRWRSLLTYWYPELDKKSRSQWMDWMRKIISTHTWSKTWDRRGDPILKMEKKKQERDRECEYYGIDVLTWDHVSRHAWYHWMPLSDLFFPGMEEDWVVITDMTKIHFTPDLWLPMPHEITQYIQNRESEVQDAFSNIEEYREEKKSWKDYFSKHVVHEMDNDVAYRPGMHKFLECQQHFESLKFR